MSERILRPGQIVILHEGDAAAFGRVEGRITSVTVYDDLSIQYAVRWWSEGEPVSADFSAKELTELHDAKYLAIDYAE